jgi:trans-aconitate 2-methyltransferase
MTAPVEWNAADYHRVSGPQYSWGLKVLDRLDLAGATRVIDAGCGSGRLTGALLARWPQGTLLAIDRSMNMLRQARGHLVPAFAGRVHFAQVALPDVPVTGWADVVFSTATFHWVLDHPALFAGLFAALRPGGRLHAQCGGGANLADAHALAARVMAQPLFAPYFAGWRGPWEFASAEQAAARLAAAGFTEIDTSLEPAPTVLEDERAYRDFVTTVNFQPHLACLPDEALRRQFVEEVTELSARSPVPFRLDYWRLNLQARRPR